MKNVDMKVEGNILTITVDLSKEFGLSSTGKNMIVATSEGNQPVVDGKGEKTDTKIGLNIYKKLSPKPQAEQPTNI